MLRDFFVEDSTDENDKVEEEEVVVVDVMEDGMSEAAG